MINPVRGIFCDQNIIYRESSIPAVLELLKAAKKKGIEVVMFAGSNIATFTQQCVEKGVDAQFLPLFNISSCFGIEVEAIISLDEPYYRPCPGGYDGAGVRCADGFYLHPVSVDADSAQALIEKILARREAMYVASQPAETSTQLDQGILDLQRQLSNFPDSELYIIDSLCKAGSEAALTSMVQRRGGAVALCHTDRAKFDGDVMTWQESLRWFTSGEILERDRIPRSYRERFDSRFANDVTAKGQRYRD